MQPACNSSHPECASARDRYGRAVDSGTHGYRRAQLDRAYSLRRVVLLAAFVFLTGCPADETSKLHQPGRIHVIPEEDAQSLASVEDRLVSFPNSSILNGDDPAVVRVFDLTALDSAPTILAPGIDCFFGCGALEPMGSTVIAQSDRGASVIDPAASQVLSAGTAGTGTLIAAGTGAIVAGYPSSSHAFAQEGDLLVRHSELPGSGYAALAVVGTSGFGLQTTLGGLSSSNNLVTFGLADPEAAEVVSTLPIDAAPGGFVVGGIYRSMAVDARDVFYWWGEASEPSEFESIDCSIRGLALDSAHTITVPDAHSFGCTTMRVAGDYLLTAANFTSSGKRSASVKVWRIERNPSSTVLSEVETYDLGSRFVSDFAVREDLDLVFISTGESIHVVDFLVLTKQAQ
jgi:hypothetical protein